MRVTIRINDLAALAFAQNPTGKHVQMKTKFAEDISRENMFNDRDIHSVVVLLFYGWPRTHLAYLNRLFRVWCVILKMITRNVSMFKIFVITESIYN